MQSGDDDGNFCLDPFWRSPHSQQHNTASFCCGNIQLQLEVRTSQKFYKGKKRKANEGYWCPAPLLAERYSCAGIGLHKHAQNSASPW